MEYQEFVQNIKNSFPPGTVVKNPGGGTSEIVSYPDEKIAYLRGKSRIYASLPDFYRAYEHFRGKHVSSSDLKDYAPEIFDSSARPAGHSCNCTMLMMILHHLGMAGPIQGNGVRGKPYYIQVIQ